MSEAADGIGTVANRRLHPAAMALRVGKEAPSALAALVAAFLSSKMEWTSLLGIAAAGVAVLALVAWVRWRHLRYGVGAGEIVIEKGFIGLTRRSIPFDRIQDVDVERGPLHRLFGLARVKVETGGGGKDEGLLDGVTLAEADRMRAAVRAAREGRAPADAPAETPAHPDQEAGRPLFAMAMPRVLASGLFNFSLVYLAGLFGGLQAFDNVLPFDIYDPGRWIGLVDGNLAHRFTVEAILTVLLLAVSLGVVLGVVGSLLRDFGFRLWAEGERFRRERGLLTRTEVVLPKRRVQLARIETGPVRRYFGWSELFFQTLSVGKDGSGAQTVAPLARAEEIAPILAEQNALRLPDPAELEMVSSRHLWRMLAMHVLPYTAIFSVAAILWAPAGLLFLMLPLSLTLALLERRFHRYGLAANLLFVRRGVIRQKLWIVPVPRIQSLALRRSWLQRRLGLATVVIDTAGAAGGGGPRIVDLREASARALLDALRA